MWSFPHYRRTDVSDNVALGHSFLRSMERSHALVYVVDLSDPAPASGTSSACPRKSWKSTNSGWANGHEWPSRTRRAFSLVMVIQKTCEWPARLEQFIRVGDG